MLTPIEAQVKALDVVEVCVRNLKVLPQHVDVKTVEACADVIRLLKRQIERGERPEMQRKE